MKARAFLLGLLVAGCGGGEVQQDNHGYGSSGFDVQSAVGIKIRYEIDEQTVSNSGIGPAFFDQAFEATVACTGITAAPPPYVIVRSDKADSICGRYFGAPPLIVVAGHPLCFRHEVVHYLLEQSTGDPNSAHGSALFAKCG
jgi:hypothetical protein